MAIVDNLVDFNVGSSGPRFYDTGKVKIGTCFIRGRKDAMTQAEVDIQGVLLGHFAPYRPKEKRGFVSRVFSFLAN